MTASRGEIWLVRLDPGAEGHELSKTRPCVVIQANALNRHSPTCVVAAVTEHSEKKAGYPFCVPLEAGEGGLSKRSVANAMQIRTVDGRRLVHRLGRLSHDALASVDQALRVVMDLERYPTE